MNKFEQLISDNSNQTLKRRASTLSTQAEVAQQTVVNQLKNAVSELKLKIVNLTDFAPETTDSLKPGSKDWNPTKWAQDLQRAKWDLYMAEEQLKIAEQTYNEYFKDEAPEQK